MKKKNLLTCLAVSLFAVILASCGGESKNKSQEEAPVSLQVKPGSTTVTGKLGNAFTIEDKSYKLSNDGIFYYISVSLTRTDAKPSIPFDDVVSIYSDDTKASYNGSFDVELYDANGDIVGDGRLGEDDFVKLTGLSAGESATVKVSVSGDDVSTAKTFKITSSVKPNPNISEKSSEEMSEDASNNDLEEINKNIEATGKAMEAAGKAAKALNELMQ